MMTTIPIQQTSIISSYSTNLTKQTSYVSSSDTTSQQSETLSLSDIAKKYNVENISPEEMAQMSQELYDNNYISLKTHALLSFQPELGDFDAILAQKTGTSSSSSSLSNQRRNFLQEWEDQLQTGIKAGLSQDEMAETKKVISLLENLKALS
ncbi:hypothetical protein [uncultured Desulfobacter sp.]|uniref:hypothetical protein n=1 Tax=uncultured Desulfobacter sp. TaxID=240139 RepID=UPI002AAAA7EF|nr:hypothetical protein [uncultured Desulfobacter sp.]